MAFLGLSGNPSVHDAHRVGGKGGLIGAQQLIFAQVPPLQVNPAMVSMPFNKDHTPTEFWDFGLNDVPDWKIGLGIKKSSFPSGFLDTETHLKVGPL